MDTLEMRIFRNYQGEFFTFLLKQIYSLTFAIVLSVSIVFLTKILPMFRETNFLFCCLINVKRDDFRNFKKVKPELFFVLQMTP